MKKMLSYFVLGVICIQQTACKDTLESIVNCSAEGLLMSVHHTVDPSSLKLVHFEARYSGSHSVESVSWEFGDGKMLTGKNLTTDYTYAASGTYTVKARIKIINGKSTCESDPVRTVVIN